MTKEEIKKELNKMIKNNGWNRCYGSFGIGATMGKKQMENNIALIGFGYIEDDRYDATATFKNFTESEEFKSFIELINGSWNKEIRNVYGADSIYVVVHY